MIAVQSAVAQARISSSCFLLLRWMFPECQFVCEDVHVLRYRPRRSGVEVCHVPTCIHRYCTFGTWTEREEAGSQAGARPGRETHAARRRMRMPPSIRGVTLSPKRRRFVLLLPSPPPPPPFAFLFFHRGFGGRCAAVGFKFAPLSDRRG